MAEQRATAEAGKGSGWFKAILGALLGLMSGAVMTYLTPLVDRFVKPAKPLANFYHEQQGLTVTFHNRSTSGTEGWWDFGDGSPLEPVSSRDSALSHTYAKPGNYTAKLSLRNFVGEESERTVAVNLDTPKPAEPGIAALDAVPLSQTAYAPAAFRISARVQNADLCIYDFGEGRPLKVITDPANEPDRLITFHRPGKHTIRLVAVNGKKTVERSQVIQVNTPPAGMACVLLTVTYQGTLLETATPVPESIFVTIPQNYQNNAYPFDYVFSAKPGFEITDAKLALTNPDDAKIVRVVKSPDRHTVHLTGELPKPSGWTFHKGKMPTLMAQVSLSQEKRTPQSTTMEPSTVHFAVPFSGTLDLPEPPKGWVDVQPTSIKLTLLHDNQVVWEESQLPRGAAVLIGNRPCKLTATVVGKQVKLDLTEVKPALKPAVN
jgi:PKD repeat protein